MAFLQTAAFASLWAFPCIAGMLTQQFSSMDLNKDGFLSEQEFIQGMNKKDDLSDASVDVEFSPVNTVSAAERKRLIERSVMDVKKTLPFKVDNTTTWTDVYGTDDEIHYVYRIDMDLQSLSSEQLLMMKPVMEAQICPKVQPAMCGAAKTAILDKGISLLTHYNDKNGNLLAECRFTEMSCR